MSNDAWGHALVLLTGRRLTEGELAARLERRGYKEDEVADVVERARSMAWLDDEALARDLFQDEVRRYRGPSRIRLAMLRRRLDPALIDSVMETLSENIDWMAIASHYVQRYDRRDGPSKLRLARKLDREGFSRSCVWQVLDVDAPATDAKDVDGSE